MNLLDEFTNTYKRIYLTKSTKNIIDEYAHHPFYVHPIARALDQWRLKNRNKIRIRNLKKFHTSNHNNEIVSDEGIILAKDINQHNNEEIDDPSLQTYQLSLELKVTLCSDEHLARNWAIDNKIQAFSTLSFINLLKEKKKVSLYEEALLYVKLNNKNFKYLPFTTHHLMSSLKKILTNTNAPINTDLLKTDDVYLTIIKQFNDAATNISSIPKFVIEFWLLILNDAGFKKQYNTEKIIQILSACIYTPSFMININKDIKNPLNIIAHLWAVFLYRSYKTNITNAQKAWSAIDSCAKLLTHDENIYNYLINIMPSKVLSIVKADQYIDNDKKTTFLYQFSSIFGDTYVKQLFEEYFVKNQSKLGFN